MPQPEDVAVLDLRSLSRSFDVAGAFGGASYTVKAVDDVSLQINRGEIFGLIGESGCGKSTIARMIMGLTTPSVGSIMLNGVDIAGAQGAAAAAARRTVQMVFQDPYSSLNPAFSVRQILWEGLSKVSRPGRAAADDAMGRLLESVGLARDYLAAYPHQLSGGQRQRVGVARALSVAPDVLIVDEPTSALDVSVQAQILDLFIELQQSLQLTMLFISHDFSVIRYLCDRVAVMYLGQVVEQGPAQEVLDHPRHHYTAGLIASLPTMAQRGNRAASLVGGELPSPTSIPTGCRFHPRCARAEDRCRRDAPRLSSASDDHGVACFFPLTT